MVLLCLTVTMAVYCSTLPSVLLNKIFPTFNNTQLFYNTYSGIKNIFYTLKTPVTDSQLSFNTYNGIKNIFYTLKTPVTDSQLSFNTYNGIKNIFYFKNTSD